MGTGSMLKVKVTGMYVVVKNVFNAKEIIKKNPKLTIFTAFCPVAVYSRISLYHTDILTFS